MPSVISFCLTFDCTYHHTLAYKFAPLSLNIRLITANMLLELEKLGSKLDFLLQEILGIQIVLGCIIGVLLNVQTNGSSRRAGAGETNNDSAARRETGVQTLLGRNRAIQIGVREVARIFDSTLCDFTLDDQTGIFMFH